MKLLTLLFPVLLSAQYRTIYPLSVVPGGIDAATVNEHITHYEDYFHEANLRHGKYYLQFAQGEDIGWTSEPKEIARGSNIFVDRHGEIKRSRCGNGISKLPRFPRLTAPLPPDKVLETPLVVYMEALPPYLFPLTRDIGFYLPEPKLPPYVSHPEAPPEFPTITMKQSVTPPPYWMMPPVIGTGFVPTVPLRPISAVPETGTAWMMVCFAALWLLSWGMRRL